MRIFAGGRERSGRDLGCEEIIAEKVVGSAAGDGGFPFTRREYLGSTNGDVWSMLVL